MRKDMPAQDGRSRAVSTDVADTIEGLMPSLMDIFAGSDEVVRFEPVGPEDEAAAAQETDYVNHVFMQQNPGFMLLYSFIKDALLSKVGIVKVWWEEREEEQRETYYDLTDDQFALLAQAVMQSGGAMKIVAHSVHNAVGELESGPERWPAPTLQSGVGTVVSNRDRQSGSRVGATEADAATKWAAGPLPPELQCAAIDGFGAVARSARRATGHAARSLAQQLIFRRSQHRHRPADRFRSTTPISNIAGV
jgi:hypothetical protein